MGTFHLPPVEYRIVEQFAGAGGWSEGLKRLKLHEHAIGVEFDPVACETAREAGHLRIEGDVAVIDPHDFEPVWGFIASPPCQSYSSAGSGKGREDRRWVEAAVHELADGRDPRQTVGTMCEDPRSLLTVEPLHWALALQPQWIALEQVPAVLPLWKLMGEVLEDAGYHVATGILSAEQYGVPQTRKRAFLIANLHREVALPAPTHTAYRKGGPKQADGLMPWISMDEALGWGLTGRPSATVTGGGTGRGGAEPYGNGARQMMDKEAAEGRLALRSNYLDGNTGERTMRSENEPAPTITSKGNRMKFVLETHRDQKPDGSRQEVNGDQPAPTFTVQSGRQWKVRSNQSVAGVGRAERSTNDPSFSVTTRADLWTVRPDEDYVYVGRPDLWYRASLLPNAAVRHISEPAPTVAFGHDASTRRWVGAHPDAPESTKELQAEDWPARRPATTLGCDPRVFQPGGHHTPGSQSQNAYRLRVEEAAVLMGFRADYPWAGAKTVKFRQIGNAVPPPLAGAVLRAAIWGRKKGDA